MRRLATTLLHGPAHAMADAVRRREVSALAIAQASAERIQATDGQVNAFTARTFDRAFAQAQLLDARLAAGDAATEALPLLGVPIAVKNLFDIQGVTTLAGSRIEANKPPAAADALLLKRLCDGGAVLMGALNMDEYAYGFTTENSHHGATHNPHDLSRVAGGSSGGSGAAIAAGQVPITLGSDTNGSIRVPSSLCGVFGLKPTYGRLPRHGTYPFVASLDHLGPFARSSRDLALAYDLMQGHDSHDPASVERGLEPTLPRLDDGAQGLRIGVLGGWFFDMAQPPARAAVDAVAQALGTHQTIDWPEVPRARAAAFIITNAEGAALHLPNLRTRPQDFDPLLRDRLLAGALLPAAWLVQAQRVRRWFARQVAAKFADVDVLLAPATPCTAPTIGTEWLDLGSQRLPVRPNLGLLAQPVSCIGLPVVTVPVWLPGQSMPIGVQVIAAPWREDHAMRVARALELAGAVRSPVASLPD